MYLNSFAYSGLAAGNVSDKVFAAIIQILFGLKALFYNSKSYNPSIDDSTQCLLK